MTFGEENDTSDLEDWDNVGLNCSRPPDLTQLYRWYCHQLNVDHEKPTHEDFSMAVNFDDSLHQDYQNLKGTVQQMVCKMILLKRNFVVFLFVIATRSSRI